MVGRIARLWASSGHRVLLVIWRYLPLWARRFAIRVLYPRFPIGAVALIRDDAGRVLLVRQTYHRAGVRWGVPGGWLDYGENPRQAAVREAFEETGLRVRTGRILAVDGGPYGEISLVFECRVIGDTGFQPSHETDRIGYFPPDQLPPMTAETRRILARSFATQAAWQTDGSPTPTPTPSPVPGSGGG